MACQSYLNKTAIEPNACLTSIKIYGCITKYRIEKTNPYLKYFLNHKIPFVCQISLNI